MEARVGLTQALAKFAYKLTAKGGQAAVDALQKKLQSTLTQTGLLGSLEKNPQIAPGGTFLQNAGVDLAPMPRTTGGGDARDDSYILKQMMSCATGVLPLYFGEIGESNLASATKMELPMLKMFGGYQELWKGGYRDLFSIVLDEDPDEEPADIQVEMPSILQDDLQALGTFLGVLTSAFPEAKVPQILRECLISMNVENVDDVMDAIELQRQKIDAQNLVNQKLALANAQAAKNQPQNGNGNANGNGNGNGKGNGHGSPATAAEVEAMNRLSAALEEGNRLPAPAIIPEISVHPQIVIASESKSVTKTARSKREANGDMTITIEESPNAT